MAIVEGTYGVGADRIAEVVRDFEMSTPWDISTATNKGSFNPAEMDAVYGVWMSNDGTKLILLNDGGDLFGYTCSTPFDVSTASYDSETILNVGSGNGDIHVNEAEGLLFIHKDGSNQVGVYTITDLDVSTLVDTGNEFTGVALTGWGVDVSPDGLHMFLGDASNSRIRGITMTTPFDGSTGSLSGDLSTLVDSGCAISSDGTKLISTNVGNAAEFTLSTPFDLTTATLDQSVSSWITASAIASLMFPRSSGSGAGAFAGWGIPMGIA